MTACDPKQPVKEPSVLRYINTLILIVAAIIVGCGDVTCDADSVEVSSVRQLNQARLQVLANDVDDMLRSNSKPAGSLWTRSGDDVPEQFRELGVILLQVNPGEVRLRLKGCMDHHVDLVVTGSTAGRDKIELWFGEGPTSGREVLWELANTSPDLN